MANTENRVVIKNMKQVLMEANPAMADMMADSPDLPMYVITNNNMINETSSVFTKTAIDMLTDIFGERYIILPSSIHECIAIEANDDQVNNLVQMVKIINGTELAPEDVLSNNIYLYDCGYRVITDDCIAE